MIALSVVCARWRPFFLPFETQLYLVSVLMTLWGLFVAVWAITKRAEFDIKALLIKSWPLLLFYALSFLILIIATVRAHFSSTILHMTFNYWFLYPAVLLAYYMGRIGDRFARKGIPALMLTISSIGFVLSVGQLLQDVGFANPVGGLVVWIRQVNLPLSTWVWNHVESIRLTGYSFDPNYFAFFALVGVVWALCGRDRMLLRVIVLAESAFMLFFSASRGVFFSAFVVLIAWVIVYRRFFAQRLKACFSTSKRRALSITVIVVLVVALFAGGTLLAARGSSLSLVGRITASLTEIRSNGLTTKSIDMILNGRGALWEQGIRLIEEKPWGHWLVERELSKMSFHNDYLVTLITGGPLFFASLIMLLVWMWRQRMRPAFRGLPVLLTLTCAFTCFFYNIFQFGAVLPLVFFLLGTYCCVSPRKSARVKSGQNPPAIGET